METLTIIGSICSILSLIIAIFVASQVVSINKQIKVKGRKNVTATGDISGTVDVK